jgi:hypothetical protein
MSLPSSSTDVCNLALDLLKEKAVADIEAPTTVVEAALNRRYDLSLATLLASRNWNFARKAAAFLLTDTPSVSIYADAYAFPNDYLKLLALFDPRHPLTRYDYMIENNLLLIDNDGDESIDAWYTRRVTVVSDMPGYFVSYFAAQLAMEVSYKITAKTSMRTELKEILTEAKQVALAANGQERPPIRFESSKIVNAGINPATQQFVAGDHTFDFEPND